MNNPDSLNNTASSPHKKQRLFWLCLVIIICLCLIFICLKSYYSKKLYQYVNNEIEKMASRVDDQTLTTYTTSPFSSCDEINKSCVVFNSKNGENMTLSDFPFFAPGWLITYENNDNALQIAVNWSDQTAKFRVSHFGEYQGWREMAFNQDILFENSTQALPSCDLNEITRQNRFYLLMDSNDYSNLPDDSPGAGFLQVLYSEDCSMQVFYPLTDDQMWKRTFKGDEIVDPGWVLCNDNRLSYNTAQKSSNDHIYNTYIIPTQPTITVDSNGWLQAIDDETTAEEEATDMTGAIMYMLESTGHCRLSPGTFYISGNIDLPPGTSLEGSGYNTLIRLLPSDESSYCVRILQNNTVRDIRFSGGKNAPHDLLSSAIQNDHQKGIIFTGNADGKEEARSKALPNNITGCWFENFDGSAFYAHNTGGNIQNIVTMSDCFIDQCRIGINIDYYTEYCKFTNCIISNCYFSCINNGGNNVFSGCTFHGVVGWLCDNSAGDKKNNMHGSCIGCTFNHINNMNHSDVLGNGSAIIILNSDNGYIFSGCQLWYGNVIIENSRAITFSNCLFGNSESSITVSGDDWGAFFNDVTFYNDPILNVNSKTKFTDCYTSDGVLVKP